ncbi:MAG: DUF45 domain-containing protein [Oscillospiraceae bacterium]|nr:DUF45 domain-containing protein [Oscillospiraceae bacterium]
MSQKEKTETLYLVVEGVPSAQFICTLTRKAVKNINLRVTRTGDVRASAPFSMPRGAVLSFLQSKSRWAYEASQRAKAQAGAMPPPPSQAQAEEALRPIAERIFPLFHKALQGQMPALSFREMKSRWGVCYPAKRKLVFNTRLALRPLPAQEYVVLHEFVHFLYPDHGKRFHAAMAALMPDYRARRKLLNDC